MKTIALFGAMLLAAGPVLAQTQTPVPGQGAAAVPPPHTAATPPRATAPKPPMTMEARVDQRIKAMHQRLKITPDQQPAWGAFAQTMHDNVTTTEQAYKARRAAIATMSAPDNMRNFEQIEQGRTDGIQKLAASFQTLYDTMSDEQKKTADAMFRQYGEHAGGHRKAGA